jgi:hypothetical protein
MNGVVTVSCLGGFGRWGNQLFQYAVARAYAESIGAELLIPEHWIGRQLFEGVTERTIHGSPYHRLDGEILDGSTNCDLFGYFQRPEHLKLLSKAKLKQWLKPKEHIRRSGHPIVLHKRRGDYVGNGYYAVISDDSYVWAMEKFGYDPNQATVYDCSRPETSQYNDFFELMASRVIFRANSTYSFWAAALSDGKVYSPVVENRTGPIDCEFEEGNGAKIMQLFGRMDIGE